MANTYGNLTFTKSIDCKYEAHSLINALNNFSWDALGGEWYFCELNKTIKFNCTKTQDPNVFPVNRIHN